MKHSLHKTSYVVLLIFILCLCSIALFFFIFFDTKNIYTPNTSPDTNINSQVLENQTTEYLQVLQTLVVSTTVTDAQVEAFLFETRVPSTFQSYHLQLAISWASKRQINNQADTVNMLTEYYQLLTSL